MKIVRTFLKTEPNNKKNIELSTASWGIELRCHRKSCAPPEKYSLIPSSYLSQGNNYPQDIFLRKKVLHFCFSLNQVSGIRNLKYFRRYNLVRSFRHFELSAYSLKAFFLSIGGVIFPTRGCVTLREYIF